MLHEVFCAVCCVCVIVGFGLMCLCHLFVVYFVMLHWLFVCVVVPVCVFVRFVCVGVCSVCDLLNVVVWFAAFVLCCVCVLFYVLACLCVIHCVMCLAFCRVCLVFVC